MLDFLERRLLFRPRPICEATPADLGLDYEATLTNTADGRSLFCWYIPGEAQTDLTWLWFGGVGANLTLRVGEFASVREHTGGNILAFDYGGFGRSNGRPSVRNTAIDARTALRHLQRRYGVGPERACYFGVSMGAAVAIRLAAEGYPPRGLALVAPFASLREMAKLSYPMVTLNGFVVGERFNSVARIGDIGCPLLVLHGADDELVPAWQGHKLFEAAREPKRYAELAGVGHLDISDNPAFWAVLCEWLATIGRESTAPTAAAGSCVPPLSLRA
jgi:fermentation-respiration switch protein FrsA (DUF1100 family)